MRNVIASIIGLWFAVSAAANEPPLRPDTRFIPGEQATPFLQYENPSARSVAICTSADQWTTHHPMQRRGTIHVLDMRTLDIPIGRYEYKFIVDGQWESGANRVIFVNEHGLLVRPSEMVHRATVEDWNVIELALSQGIRQTDRIRVRLHPEVPVREIRMSTPAEEGFASGYVIHGPTITFYFNPEVYHIRVSPSDQVVVAGNFNDWDSQGRGGAFQLHDRHRNGIWEMTMQLNALRPPPGQRHLEFKFVINGEQWLVPPPSARNRRDDGHGNVNLRIDPEAGAGRSLRIITEEPLELSRNYIVILDGLDDRTAYNMTSPGRILDTFYSDKELGVVLDRTNNATTYRLFAPRAKSVHLNLYDTHRYAVHEPEFRRLEPVERYPMWKDEADGVWEISVLGLDIGRYYSFNVDGPDGEGENFYPEANIGDPYARAAALDSDYNNIVIDPDATNQWFGGWTDDEYRTPPHQNVMIYEVHVRDMTMHPSSKVPPSLRGKYAGILATEGTGTGIDHIRDMGFNMIELLPIAEFHNNVDEYNWGYASVFFAAPDASYGRAPIAGSQYYEFKHLVNELHRRGLGVMLDVVYNHVGHPNIFSLIDRKYYFRLNPDYTYSNFSGVGNDVRSEAPMMRRFIVDDVLYWMREHHVDGFRFDLAELIDMETLRQIRREAVKVNPDVILVSEPWSFRGTHKYELRGTGWSAWNDYFRNTTRGFVMGDRALDRLKQVIIGSTDLWTANPLQSVNYVESHDDMALADVLCLRPDRDGRHLQSRDVAANRLAATVLFTSLGIPMIHSGQEFLRSKRGISNTYNRGDEVNALRWTDRERPVAAEAMQYYRGLAHLRRSPQGAAFRVTERPPASYYQWIHPRDEQALGYIVNAPRQHAGAGFIVLLNGSPQSVTFPTPIPAGRWRMIGDGRQIAPDGLPNTEVLQGPLNTNIRVPSMSSVIFMNGF